MQLRNISNFVKSDAYREEIHQLIPGGAHTYSKGDDQFPSLAPAAIDYGKGSHVWDIDGNEFLDCSLGLTSVSLGHAYEPVLDAVRAELLNGVNFQRPSSLEKTTAEKFLALIPQHDMIKFAKNGSIVTTAAVKLARAFTGRKLVAFPGDHPFYSYDDWFIGRTNSNKGVPDEFTGLSVTFQSCNLASLQALFEKYPDEIACVITEPEKSTCYGNTCSCNKQPGKFLEDAIALAHRYGALFIVDEMVTGFKSDFPGSITKFGIKPDMATWGKGIANGFSFCALTGVREVMELGGITSHGQDKVFLISTTHGGETHTLAAANATIGIFESEDVIRHSHRLGNLIIEKCDQAIANRGMKEYVQVMPCNWFVTFGFNDAEKNASASFRTLFMQEMIRRGVLFQSAFYPCYSHNEDDVHYFVEAFTQSLEVYQSALKDGVGQYLVGDAVKPVFRKTI